jgi:hypothetical protein
MTESKDLVLVNEQLRRSNRRWKALALTACAALIGIVLFGLLRADRQRMQVEAAMRHARMALADAQQARSSAEHR